MSCTDNLSSYLNLFKVACINYLPNPVTYQNKSIKRTDLITIQRVVTDIAREYIEEVSDFKPTLTPENNSTKTPSYGT